MGSSRRPPRKVKHARAHGGQRLRATSHEHVPVCMDTSCQSASGSTSSLLSDPGTFASELMSSFSIQNPRVPLPSGVEEDARPQHFQISEDQISSFERDGVTMIPGACSQWVDYLRAVTQFQLDNPHVYSLPGRMGGLYDYIQQDMWMTNDGFRDFLYYSPVGHIAAQLGRTETVRVASDMLLVNPNVGFSWHQDNTKGPVEFCDAIRWWVALDPCNEDGVGVPEFLVGSHRNSTVKDRAVFVDISSGDLASFPVKTRFLPKPGDMIVWDARAVHRVTAPSDFGWSEGTQRRAINGTMAKAGAVYQSSASGAISDLTGHDLQDGDKLAGPYFPQVYPDRMQEETLARQSGALVARAMHRAGRLVADRCVPFLKASASVHMRRWATVGLPN